jgi:hypothetical protein
VYGTAIDSLGEIVTSNIKRIFELLSESLEDPEFGGEAYVG